MSLLKVIGQNKALPLLLADLNSNRVADSYLFAGPNGVGKKTAALEFAKAVNCLKLDARYEVREASDGQPSVHYPESRISDLTSCDSCSSCRKMNDGTHPDVFILNFETQAKLLDMDEEKEAKQKEYSIKSVRILLKWAYLTPSEAKKRTFIIDGAEFLNEESGNALLKVLEEAPGHSQWILLAASADRVILTIRSRCRKVYFAPLSPEQVQQILTHLLPEIAEKDIREASNVCGGSVEAARLMLEQESLELGGIADQVLSFKKTNKNPSRAFQSVLDFTSQVIPEGKKPKAKKRIEQFLKILLLKISGRLRVNADAKSAEQLAVVLSAQQELRRNVSSPMVLDSLFSFLLTQ